MQPDEVQCGDAAPEQVSVICVNHCLVAMLTV